MNIETTPGQTTQPRRIAGARRLMPGDWVEVRSEAEILATLDDDGTLDHLPFMPEMRRFVGRRLRVRARADRTIAENGWLRSMDDTVHLEGAYCDGAAHDGCARTCLLFWKEAWLARVDAPSDAHVRVERVRELAHKMKTAQGEGYFCQATQLHLASAPLRVRNFFRHVSALWNEGVSAVDLGHSFLISAHDLVQRHVAHGNPWSVVPGTCEGKTPAGTLDLQPGERVRVKSATEILATLDANGNNRGMEFSREMLRYCGKEFTVLRRCQQVIRDNPPKMVRMKDTVILEGLGYAALSYMAIPRSEWFFWRECWLERVTTAMAS